MRNVSRHLAKSELNKRRLAMRCEVRGREIYSAGGQYLGLAETAEQAEVWGQTGEMLKLCEEAAAGQTPSRERFADIVKRIAAIRLIR
jgi:hypothetical protein